MICRKHVDPLFVCFDALHNRQHFCSVTSRGFLGKASLNIHMEKKLKNT